MEKPEYIEHIEKKNNTLFSKITINETLLYEKIISKDFYDIITNSEYIDGKVEISEIIYKTKQGFYLYVVRNPLYKMECSVDIYYSQEQHNELLFFIKPFTNSVKK